MDKNKGAMPYKLQMSVETLFIQFALNWASQFPEYRIRHQVMVSISQQYKNEYESGRAAESYVIIK
jgi:hypothetical protein